MIKKRGYRKLIILFFATLLTGCSGSQTLLSPKSVTSSEIYRIILIIFGIAAAVFVVVEGALLYATLRFSREKKGGLPKQVDGNRKLEIAWTAAPALVLMVVFFVSLPTLRSLTSEPDISQVDPGKPVLHVHVIARQWWWEFDYPDLHLVTAGEMYVPLNTVIAIDVDANDVIHSFWVPPLGGKIDVIPGHTNHTWFEVTESGAYTGQCAEFCGVDHAFMRFEVVAEPQADFESWTRLMQTAAAVMTGEAAQGEQVFLSVGCIACHTIIGTPAQGKIGPDLSHFALRSKFAGWTIDNTPENLSKWLANPQAVIPGTSMPNLRLSQEQVSALVAFLDNLK